MHHNGYKDSIFMMYHGVLNILSTPLLSTLNILSTRSMDVLMLKCLYFLLPYNADFLFFLPLTKIVNLMLYSIGISNTLCNAYQNI